MQINLSDEAVRLLRGILASHKDQLEQVQEGEPWQPAELELTKQLISAFAEE